jgi:phytanoyl-CoA hydroxylase
MSSTARFTDEELAAFHRDGYIIARNLAGVDLCRRMRDVVAEHLANRIEPIEYEADLHYPGAPESREAVGGQTPRRLKAAHARGIPFSEWLDDPKLVGRLRQIFSGDVVMPLAHHNCIMTKEPRYSSDTGWHQDVRYWSFTRPELVSVWLALGPEIPENGSLKLIPGTHRLTIRPEQLDSEKFLRNDLPENQALIARSIDARLDEGDVLFFHCRTFHAASRNFTSQSKFSVVFTFRPADNPPLPGSRSASQPELLLPSPP